MLLLEYLSDYSENVQLIYFIQTNIKLQIISGIVLYFHTRHNCWVYEVIAICSIVIKYICRCVKVSDNSLALTCIYCYMCGFILAESLYPCEKTSNQRYNKEITRYNTHFNTLYERYFKKVPW